MLARYAEMIGQDRIGEEVFFLVKFSHIVPRIFFWGGGKGGFCSPIHGREAKGWVQ